MDQNKEKICYILQYYFDNGDNASQACEKSYGVYGEGAVSKSTARKCFARFRSGNFNVKDFFLLFLTNYNPLFTITINNFTDSDSNRIKFFLN